MKKENGSSKGSYLPGVGGETVISVTDSCLTPMVSLVRSAAFAAPPFLLGQVDVDEGSVRWPPLLAAVYEWVVMEGGGEKGISSRGSGVFSPSSSMGSSSLTCSGG